MYYTGNEIVEIAVRIEENGYAFYTNAAEMVGKENDIKSLFIDLAEKEVLHMAKKPKGGRIWPFTSQSVVPRLIQISSAPPV